MRYVKLIATADEYDTAPGFKIDGARAFEGFMACRDGTLTAHDILEHQNGISEIGSVWDELEALGGIWQVRGRHGDLLQRTPNIHSPAANVASDVTRMFSEWIWTDCRYCGPHSNRTQAHVYDDDFREILDIARHDIPHEFEPDGANGGPDWTPEDLELYLACALHRMRTGFRKAERRFGTHFGGHNLFREIRDAVEKAAKWIDYEGQEFRLAYGNGEARCYEIAMPDDY